MMFLGSVAPGLAPLPFRDFDHGPYETYQALAAGEAIEGSFSYYMRSPTDDTLAYRIGLGQVPAGMDGYIATSNCDLIGETAQIWLQDADQIWRGPFRVAVFDCAGHSSTVRWMRQDRIIAELDFYLTDRHGRIGGGGFPGRLRWESVECSERCLWG